MAQCISALESSYLNKEKYTQDKRNQVMSRTFCNLYHIFSNLQINTSYKPHKYSYWNLSHKTLGNTVCVSAFLFLSQMENCSNPKKKNCKQNYSWKKGEPTLFAFIGFAQHLALISHLRCLILLFLFAYDGGISSCPSNAMELSQPMKYSICLWT